MTTITPDLKYANTTTVYRVMPLSTGRNKIHPIKVHDEDINDTPAFMALVNHLKENSLEGLLLNDATSVFVNNEMYTEFTWTLGTPTEELKVEFFAKLYTEEGFSNQSFAGAMVAIELGENDATVSFGPGPSHPDVVFDYFGFKISWN